MPRFPILPEIGAGAAIMLGVLALIGGVLAGTHWPWPAQILALVAAVYAVEVFGGHLEMGAIAYIPAVVGFGLGMIIGDVSWAFQTDAIVISTPELGNPFIVK